MVRNDCAMTNVKSRFTDTVMLWPADRVSKGKTSLGMSQPNPPHDHANAATYKHMRMTRVVE